MVLTLADFPRWFVLGFTFVFGLLWGSFLNVVIYRVPKEMSVVKPASHCPACGKPVKPYDNIPVLSFLILRGKARCCGAKLSVRYPLVELMGGVLSLAIVEAVLYRGDDMSAGRALAIYCVDLALALGLVAAAFIDLEHMFLPDSITIGGAILGVATASFRDMTFRQSLVGAASGFLMVWVPFILIYPKIRGRAGMGLGDAKLLMLAGAWFGWAGAFFVLCAGAMQGTLAAITMLLVKGKIEEPEAVKREREEIKAELAKMSPEERAEVEKELADDPLAEEAGDGVGKARLAFGPFLALATIECLLLGKDIYRTALQWMQEG